MEEEGVHITKGKTEEGKRKRKKEEEMTKLKKKT